MRTPVSTIRNLGPAVEAACTAAGIPDAETLRALGAEAAYAKLIGSGMKPHFIGYCAMVMGLQGRPWNDCHGDEKKALRARFDSLKAQIAATPEDELERLLDEIGVRAR
ncbi:TfoX/Sxy family DNA transformation protein [Marimonas sp. MJW-29]|uniref:TfoX/Sxy family DNA transformation protein n=1 Tax=Sulfitobacter sediminis TaxID=3234186 RepID=A0ABV3RJ61_9RHOB